FLKLEQLTAHVYSDFFRQVAVCDGGRHFGDVADLCRQVGGHEVDVVRQILPGSRDFRHLGLPTKLAFGADFARNAGDFRRERVELVDHRVDGVFEFEDFAFHVHGDLARQVTACHGGRHFGNIADLSGKVPRHRIHRVSQVFPGAAPSEPVRLAAEPAFGADFARDARHFAGESVELVHHRVDGFLQLQDLARHVHGDFFRKVATGDGGRDVGNVTDLCGQVAGHEVHAVGQVLPCAGYARHGGLTTEFAFRADFAGNARDFRSEAVELVHHRIDGVFQLENLAAHIDRDLARQVPACHGGRDLRDVADLVGQIAAHGVHRVGEVLPCTGDTGHDGLPAELPISADFAGNARHFRC